MTLTSPDFFLFFLVVLLFNFYLKGRAQRLLLLMASGFFIGCFSFFSLFIAVVSSGLNFLGGVLLEKKKSRWVYLFFITVNVAAMFITNFSLHSFGFIQSLPRGGLDLYSLFIGVGISFYSLSHIAYITDVWKSRIEAESKWPHFLLFTLYFPKLLAGPVTLFQQFKFENAIPTQDDLWSGFGRISLGLLKKLVLADRLAPSVVALYNYPETMPGINVITAGFLFTLQLYFDFSGYTDIALGCSRALGISLPENFFFPLRSTSVTIFWRRWHQSLLHFFSSYIYYPVTFRLRRYGRLALCLAIVLTFGISALWHGLNSTFFIWGACHIAFLLIELFTISNTGELQESSGLLKRSMHIALTLVLVSFSNIFFRSPNWSEVTRMGSLLFSGNFFPTYWFREFVSVIAQGGHQQNIFNLLITIFLVIGFLSVEVRINSNYLNGKPKWILLLVTLIFILVFGVFGNTSQFIYAQFT